MGSTGIQLGKFGGQNIQAVQTESTFQQISAELQTRTKKDTTSDEEEYRWVVRVALRADYCDVQGLGFTPINNDILPPFPDPWKIRSCIKGGPDFDVHLDSTDFSEFRCVSDTITGVEAEGSKIATNVQQYVALSKWTDAPWNGYWP